MRRDLYKLRNEVKRLRNLLDYKTEELKLKVLKDKKVKEVRK